MRAQKFISQSNIIVERKLKSSGFKIARSFLRKWEKNVLSKKSFSKVIRHIWVCEKKNFNFSKNNLLVVTCGRICPQVALGQCFISLRFKS